MLCARPSVTDSEYGSTIRSEEEKSQRPEALCNVDILRRPLDSLAPLVAHCQHYRQDCQALDLRIKRFQSRTLFETYIFVFVVQPELEEGKKGASSTNLGIIIIMKRRKCTYGSNKVLITLISSTLAMASTPFVSK